LPSLDDPFAVLEVEGGAHAGGIDHRRDNDRARQSTLENWQSEFLQLFSFVVLSALLIHRWSGESKDSADRMEQKIDGIAKRLDELAGGKAPVVGH